jgi:UDP-N-acetylglucosamine diphosphorylase / glucose-1-phosphate thymidylyltransferase / UDP-N-acetylgalactosamine diphosphorylase / glucosamine-1-phosphate N-acetyltransferase / galactosamine-1-phosphate N-acetyltransferase
MKAVLLAAGKGIRLLPLTATRPKHLIKVAGKPILQFCLEAVKNAGITEIVVVTHYKGNSIRKYFGNGEEVGLTITYIEQTKILGTGNATSAAEPFVNGDFILIYGDLLFGPDVVKSVLRTYEKEEAAAVMGVVSVDKPENYGIVELDECKRVKRIVEKPAAGEAPSNLANAGVYVFSPDVFNIIRETKASLRGEWELTDAVTLLAEQGRTILATEISRHDWFDVGRPWDLLDANIWALERMEHKVLGTVEQGAHLIGPVSVAKTARIRSGAYVEGPAFIDEESDVGPNCYIRAGTSLGKKVRIGNACEVKNSIIMDSTHVGHLSYVGDSIFGENCNVGAGTITANYRLDAGSIKMMVNNQLINTGRRKLGAVFGDRVKTGINALIMPGIKVGNNSWVGANSVAYRDIPANTILTAKQDEYKQEKSIDSLD